MTAFCEGSRMSSECLKEQDICPVQLCGGDVIEEERGAYENLSDSLGDTVCGSSDIYDTGVIKS